MSRGSTPRHTQTTETRFWFETQLRYTYSTWETKYQTLLPVVFKGYHRQHQCLHGGGGFGGQLSSFYAGWALWWLASCYHEGEGYGCWLVTQVGDYSSLLLSRGRGGDYPLVTRAWHYCGHLASWARQLVMVAGWPLVTRAWIMVAGLLLRGWGLMVAGLLLRG